MVAILKTVRHASDFIKHDDISNPIAKAARAHLVGMSVEKSADRSTRVVS